MEDPRLSPWYQYLDIPQRELVDVSFLLLQKKDLLSELKDFSFLVFPLSKAYEGFLKKVFFDLNLINRETYQGRRFRIGRAFNPDVRNHQRDEDWLYDNVETVFGREIARQLWETWLQCRNRVFHYFASDKQALSLQEAKQKIDMITQSMQLVATHLLSNRIRLAKQAQNRK